VKNSANFDKEILIEPLSPVFIGSGEKVGKFETLVADDKTYILNFDKLMENEKFVQYFIANTDKILNPQIKDQVLSEIFKRLNMNIEEYSYSSFRTIMDKEGKPRTLQIHRFIRSAGRYYIPGSSIKGALRTMIIKSNPKISSEFKAVFGLEREQFFRKVENIEEQIFGEPQASPFKLLRIADSTFIDSSHMKFKVVAVVHLVKPRQSIPQFYELWLPDLRNNEANKVKSRISFIFSDLNKLGNKKGGVNYFSELFADEKAFMSKMKEGARIIIDMEMEKIKTIPDEKIRTPLKNFYETLQKINNEMKNGFLLRVGGHTSFYSKTGYREFLSKDEVEKLKRFFGYSKVTVTNFPITTRIAKLSESPNDIMPLGWLKIEFLS